MNQRDDPQQPKLLWGTEPDEQHVEARMVILARESRGWNQRELASKIGVSQGEMSKLEAGMRGVSDAILDRLSDVLHYPTSFFSQQEQIYGGGLGEIFHRRRQDISAKVLAQIHAKINIRRIHATRLLRAADVPECRIPRVDTSDVTGPLVDTVIIDVARRVRASWHMPHGPIANLSGAIEDAGGIVIPVDFETRQVDAISQWIPGSPPLFFINTEIPQDRVRFSLAHELAHLILHQGVYVGMDGTLDSGVERQANVFASEFLMPEADIKPELVGLSLQRLAILKPYWRVAMQALLMRARDLGQITSRHFKTLWLAMSKAGYRTREPAELDIKSEAPSILRELLDHHQQALQYSIKELADFLDWFEDETIDVYFPSRRSRLRVVE